MSRRKILLATFVVTAIGLLLVCWKTGFRIGSYAAITDSISTVRAHSNFAQEKLQPPEYPDIKWQPQEYKFVPGASPRYVDYENGSDQDPGTKERPWKHHPWDKNAKANAAACKGIHTYCFKRGVAYRGKLVAKESGQSDNPICFTSDPTWGTGKASIYGSVLIKGIWKRCAEAECPEIPTEGRMHTWFIDLDKSFVPRMLWETREGQVSRIPIARSPNWQIVDLDDPRSQWWEFTDRVLELEITLETDPGFRPGDRITGTGQWADIDENRDNTPKSLNTITKVNKNSMRVESFKWKKDEIKIGSYITNGKLKAKVAKLSGSHDVISRLIDDKHLNQPSPEYWVGATMWAEKESMPKPDAERVIAYDPQKHSLRINYHRGFEGAGRYDRYFLENLPALLDSPGEYFYAEKGEHAGRLFLRLPGNRDPNLSTIEAAREYVLIDISNKSNITVAGLDLRFSNAIDCGTEKARHAAVHASAIRVTGRCSHIRVLNSEISNVPAGVIAWPESKGDMLDCIEVSDNHFHDIDSAAIGISNGLSHYSLKNAGARVNHISILRNKVEQVGYRVLSHWGLGPHAIHVEGGELVEVAGNIIDRTWGAGIIAFNGSEYENGGTEHPLMRVLVHDNKVTNCLLGVQDYGGIASWMGGPSYIYNNVVGNPVGYKHAHYRRLNRKNWYRSSCYGVGIYLDGQYKGYVFNNIVWGKNNNVNDRIYNSCAFNEAMGFMNVVFNNTFYRFGLGLHKGMSQHNRCYYLGNLMLDMGHKFIQQEPAQSAIEYDSLAYAANVFNGEPPQFGQLGEDVFPTLRKWSDGVAAKGVMSGETGVFSNKPQVLNATAHDFRLRPDSIAIDNGVRFFVPWGLYSVVGEWNFLYHPHDPTVILGENINWNNEWLKRDMFHHIPRNDFRATNITQSNFETGILENWTSGALRLDRKNQCCYPRDPKSNSVLDMDLNNFLIEAVVKPDKGCFGDIVSKQSEKGYCLDITEAGQVRLVLDFGRSQCVRLSKATINDGQWHHIIAEIDRSKAQGINIYLDGKLSNGQWKGEMNKKDSIANDAVFAVGATEGSNRPFLKFTIDFLRVSRGTLEDAETNIEELYNWEFNGPFLKDFYSRVRGKCRDAGALEYTES